MYHKGASVRCNRTEYEIGICTFQIGCDIPPTITAHPFYKDFRDMVMRVVKTVLSDRRDPLFLKQY